MKARKTEPERPGVEFEKIIAALQSQIDPSAVVTHNEVLEDRLCQRRQFDVTVRGTFAGQSMLGVIECKDLNRKVGIQEVDAFVTKAQDVNANFKILMSRRGFTGPALAKCEHYGIQALSLLANDPVNRQFRFGTYWEADVIRWGRVFIGPDFVDENQETSEFNVAEVTIQGRQVLDWFKNYLLDHADSIEGFGWVVGVQVIFEVPRLVSVRPGVEVLCSGLRFHAERLCDKLERFVGINGAGFYNWREGTATFPPGQLLSDPVPVDDFSQWQPRGEGSRRPSGFGQFQLTASALQFERVVDAIDLGQL